MSFCSAARPLEALTTSRFGRMPLGVLPDLSRSGRQRLAYEECLYRDWGDRSFTGTFDLPGAYYG